MSKTIDFRVNGNDPTLANVKAMLNGIGVHLNDRSLTVTETRVISVTTERDDVAKIVSELAKASAPKKKYQRKQGVNLLEHEEEIAEVTNG